MPAPGLIAAELTPAPPTLAPASAASRAAEAPPALLAPGVEAGKFNGVMAPRLDPRAGPEALDPPRGGSAAPPPGCFAGCHGAEMPCGSTALAAGASFRVSQSPAASCLAACAVAAATLPAPPAALTPSRTGTKSGNGLSSVCGTTLGLFALCPACFASS